MLSLSLFCCGIAAAQSTATTAGPPGISVVDSKWEKVRFFSKAAPTIDAPVVDEQTGQLKPPNDNSDLRRSGDGSLPPDARTKAVNDELYKSAFGYFISIKVENNSPRNIRSIAYDYVFTDPGNKEELKRYSLRAFGTIGVKETKWLKSGPGLGPPQKVSIAGLQKDKRSPFDERAEIKCVLFMDGTGWKAPDADQKTCDELVKFTLNPPQPSHRSNGAYIP